MRSTGRDSFPRPHKDERGAEQRSVHCRHHVTCALSADLARKEGSSLHLGGPPMFQKINVTAGTRPRCPQLSSYLHWGYTTHIEVDLDGLATGRPGGGTRTRLRSQRGARLDADTHTVPGGAWGWRRATQRRAGCRAAERPLSAPRDLRALCRSRAQRGIFAPPRGTTNVSEDKCNSGHKTTLPTVIFLLALGLHYTHRGRPGRPSYRETGRGYTHAATLTAGSAS